MASGKTRNPVSVTRAHKLPPIREETFSGRKSGSPDVKVHYEVHRKALDPVQDVGKVHVRPLPARKSKSPKYRSPRFANEPVPVIPVYDKPLSPVDSTQTLVDGVVADYLHYAKYGHVIPIYEGTSNLSCPCCTDRNRENVRTLLGLPGSESDLNQDNLQLRQQRDPNPSQLHPYNDLRHHGDPRPYNDPRHHSVGQPWLSTQPLPYASNYLNPEFNRPLMIHNYRNETRNEDKNRLINTEVITASKQFEESMRKLEKFGF